MVGFGTWALHGRAARDAVGAALTAGYRHIDTATMYRNEESVGQALRESGVPRERHIWPGALRRARAVIPIRRTS